MFGIAKMQPIPTVSLYVSIYLANWRSDCSMAHFLCQTKVKYSDILHYVFSISTGKANFCYAKSLFP